MSTGFRKKVSEYSKGGWRKVFKKTIGKRGELWYDDKQSFYENFPEGTGEEAANMKKRRTSLLLPAWALVLTLSGCLFQPPDNLYRLPEMSAGYDQLNEAIRAVRSSLESEYGVSADVATIVSGDNTATIQLQDLDGDGSRESAVTFLQVPGVEKSLKIYVFRQVEEDIYQAIGVVEGDGNAIYAVDYVDLNGTGSKELVVCWQISTGVYQLGAYTLDELAASGSAAKEEPSAPSTIPSRVSLLATELLLTSCSSTSDGSSGYRLADLDLDNQSEIAVARIDSGGVDSRVEVYSWQEGSLVSLGSAGLSNGAVTLNRIQSNYLGGDYYIPALYVTCTLTDGSRSVDVMAMQEGAGGRQELVNLALDDTGVSRNLIQGYTDVSLSDVNEDMVLELPSPQPLPTYGNSQSTNFWLIDWSQYDNEGTCSRVMTTYHNVVDSWYLIIPEEWRGRITISRNDQVTGQREVVFSLWRGEDLRPVPFLSIYRSAQAPEDAFVLRDEGTVVYSARFHEGGWDCGLDETGLLEHFRTIRSSWYS